MGSFLSFFGSLQGLGVGRVGGWGLGGVLDPFKKPLISKRVLRVPVYWKGSYNRRWRIWKEDYAELNVPLYSSASPCFINNYNLQLWTGKPTYSALSKSAYTVFRFKETRLFSFTESLFPHSASWKAAHSAFLRSIFSFIKTRLSSFTGNNLFSLRKLASLKAVWIIKVSYGTCSSTIHFLSKANGKCCRHFIIHWWENSVWLSFFVKIMAGDGGGGGTGFVLPEEILSFSWLLPQYCSWTDIDGFGEKRNAGGGISATRGNCLSCCWLRIDGRKDRGFYDELSG